MVKCLIRTTWSRARISVVLVALVMAGCEDMSYGEPPRPVPVLEVEPSSLTFSELGPSATQTIRIIGPIASFPPTETDTCETKGTSIVSIGKPTVPTKGISTATVTPVTNGMCTITFAKPGYASLPIAITVAAGS